MTGQWFEDCGVSLAAVFGGLALSADSVLKPVWARMHACIVQTHTHSAQAGENSPQVTEACLPPFPFIQGAGVRLQLGSSVAHGYVGET